MLLIFRPLIEFSVPTDNLKNRIFATGGKEIEPQEAHFSKRIKYFYWKLKF
jgi:hypothetical protein